jgi:hypothetical protein
MKDLLVAITIRTTVAARRLVRVSVAVVRVITVVTTTTAGRLVRVTVGGSRGLVLIAVTATEGRLVRGTVGVVITVSVTGGLILITVSVTGGLILIVVIRARASGRLSFAVGLAVDRLLLLIVTVLVSGLGSLLLGLAVMLGLAVPPATVADRGLVAVVVARGGAGRSLATVAVFGGGAGRSLAAIAVFGGGPNGAGAVAGSTATAAHRERGGVDAAGRDVVVVLTLDVTRRPVLANEHFVVVHSTPNLLGSLPDTLRIVTRSLGEAATEVGALVKPLTEDHFPRVAVAVVSEILAVIATGVLHVGADVVGPTGCGSRELVVPFELRDTVGAASVVVGLEALGLEVVRDGTRVTGATRAGAFIGATMHGTLGVIENRVRRDAGGEKSDSDSRTHVD